MIQSIVCAVPKKLFQYMHILYQRDKTPKIKPRSKGDCGAIAPNVNDFYMKELAPRLVPLFGTSWTIFWYSGLLLAVPLFGTALRS